MNYAIIVAAGSGTRFNSEQPKQFLPLLGKPLILHTLERFEACPDVDEIVLVLSKHGAAEFSRIAGESSFSKLRSVVEGGPTRAASVKKGLDAFAPAYTDIIAIHDGARPLVTSDEITRTIEKASEIGAACLVAEVTDTIKTVDPRFGTIEGTVDRSELRRALTPQAFRYDILEHAFRDGFDVSATDECSLVENLDYAYPIAFVEGSARNIKVTRPEDVELAELYLRNKNDI